MERWKVRFYAVMWWGRYDGSRVMGEKVANAADGSAAVANLSVDGTQLPRHFQPMLKVMRWSL